MSKAGFAVGALLAGTIGTTALAQDLDSVSDLVTDIWELNHKELTVKSSLSNVARDGERFEMLNEKDYTLSFTCTDAVISAVGSC